MKPRSRNMLDQNIVLKQFSSAQQNSNARPVATQKYWRERILPIPTLHCRAHRVWASWRNVISGSACRRKKRRSPWHWPHVSNFSLQHVGPININGQLISVVPHPANSFKTENDFCQRWPLRSKPNSASSRPTQPQVAPCAVDSGNPNWSAIVKASKVLKGYLLVTGNIWPPKKNIFLSSAHNPSEQQQAILHWKWRQMLGIQWILSMHQVAKLSNANENESPKILWEPNRSHVNSGKSQRNKLALCQTKLWT